MNRSHVAHAIFDTVGTIAIIICYILAYSHFTLEMDLIVFYIRICTVWLYPVFYFCSYHKRRLGQILLILEFLIVILFWGIQLHKTERNDWRLVIVFDGAFMMVSYFFVSLKEEIRRTVRVENSETRFEQPEEDSVHNRRETPYTREESERSTREQVERQPLNSSETVSYV